MLFVLFKPRIKLFKNNVAKQTLIPMRKLNLPELPGALDLRSKLYWQAIFKIKLVLTGSELVLRLRLTGILFFHLR